MPPGPTPKSAPKTASGSAGSSARRKEPPGAADLLAAAVAGIGGAERPGQVAMAEAVERSFAAGEHLAVQAGTGTGKSLAYLVPAARYAVTEQATVVVSTATIALQRQLIDRDLPRLAAALKPLLGREPVFAILKGRRNYLCLQRLSGGAPEEPGEMLFDPRAISATGRQVERLHEWAETTLTGDRDELVPGVSEIGLAPGVGQRPGVHRGAALPVRPGVLRRAGPVRGRPRPTSWSRTTRCWPSTRWRTSRRCPSTT